jgi:hypothetical protein
MVRVLELRSARGHSSSNLPPPLDLGGTQMSHYLVLQLLPRKGTNCRSCDECSAKKGIDLSSLSTSVWHAEENGVCRICVSKIRGLVASSLASIGVYTSTLILGHRTKTLLLGRSYGPSEDGMTISNHYTSYHHLQTEVEPLTGGVELSSTKLQLSNLQVSLVEG